MIWFHFRAKGRHLCHTYVVLIWILSIWFCHLGEDCSVLFCYYDYIYIVINYLHISFHGNFVEPEDVPWKRNTIGKPPQKLICHHLQQQKHLHYIPEYLQCTKYTTYLHIWYSPLKLILKLGASFLPFLDFTGGSLMNFRISDI